MRRITLIILSLVSAVLLAAGVGAEEIKADLTLLSHGEFANVHFDPSFEENMTESERIAYKALETGVETMKVRVDVSAAGYTDAEAFSTFVEAVLNSHPLWNSVDDEVTYTVTDGVITAVSFTYPDANTALHAEAEAYDPTESEIAHALKDIKPGMTDVEKALILHDYLVREVDYNLAVVNGGSYSQDVFSMKGVFVNRDAVCQGYALAYSFLLNEVGIESVIVSSKVMNHAWNMIKIDGEWYHVDVTWDDPTNNYEVDFCRGGFGRHTYFLRSDAEFLYELEHTGWVNWNTGWTAPRANKSDAFIGYAFRPTANGDVGIISYASGYYYALDSIYGSNVMVKQKMDGSDKTEITLPRSYEYLFFFNGYLYGSTGRLYDNYVYEMYLDGTDKRIVAASIGMIRNFWLKQDTLGYYESLFGIKVNKKTIDLSHDADNMVTQGDFVYILDDLGEAFLAEYKGTGKKVTVPAAVLGHPVIAIGESVFEGNTALNEVVLPESVILIEDRAFMQSNVKKVTFPSTLEIIDEYAFFNCNYLTDVTLPENLKELRAQAFYACFRLKNVKFEGSVPTTWGKDVFGQIESQIKLYYTAGKNGWGTATTFTDPNGVSYTAAAYKEISLDVNGDGKVNLADAAYLKKFMVDPVNYPLDDAAHDYNGDGVTTVADATVLLWQIVGMN